MAIVVVALTGSLATAARPVADSSLPLTFGAPVWVDKTLAGGEPFVIQSTKYGTLLYSSHEGTTHLDRSGFTGTPSFASFVLNYRNQVNNWTSTDGGKTWQFVSALGTGINQPGNTGFSDPDLTADEGGRIYNTGINLANDALFSSGDGGKTFDRATTECASGDRPWLAGGTADNVYMSSNLNTAGHAILHSGDGGSSCDGVPPGGILNGMGAVPADGTLDGVSWTGDGKLYYDHVDGSLVEPTVFSNKDGSYGLGVDYLPHAQAAFPADGSKRFTAIDVVPTTTIFAHWPAMAMDSAENVYLTWDTDPRSATEANGCSQSATPLANQVMLVVGKHIGPQQWSWSQPITVASPPTHRVLWPWVQVGSPGNVSVVWYEYDKVVDPDCATDGNVYIWDAHVLGALTANPQVQRINASDRAIHTAGICQGGTGCVATGQDRRLGDFLTNAVDAAGCVMIVSGDTSLPDPVTGLDQPISHPIFIKQLSGPGLNGGDCAAPSAGSSPQPVSVSGGPASSGAGGTPTTSTGLSPWVLLLLLLCPVALALPLVGRRTARKP
jgi:hypothetical protein